MKRSLLFMMVLAAVSILSMGITLEAEASSVHADLMVEGERVQPDVPAQIKSGRTFVPIRFIAENMGTEVNWYQTEKRIEMIKGNTHLSMYLNQKVIKVNGQAHQMDTAPFLQTNRTMVPLRFVSEHLGLNIGWESSKKLVIISNPIQLSVNGEKITSPETFNVDGEVYVPILDIADRLSIGYSRQGPNYTFTYLENLGQASLEKQEAETSQDNVFGNDESTLNPYADHAEKSDDEEADLDQHVEFDQHKEEIADQELPQEEDQTTELDEQQQEEQQQEEQQQEEQQQEEQQQEEQQSYEYYTYNQNGASTIVRNPALHMSAFREINDIQMVNVKYLDATFSTNTEYDETQRILQVTKDVHLLKLQNITLEDGRYVLHIPGINGMDVEHFFLRAPHRLVLDIPLTVLSDELESSSALPLAHDTVDQLRVGQFSMNPATVRVVFDLNKRSKVDFQVYQDHIELTLEERKPLVVIDAGHGAHDPGAIGSYSREKDIVLQVSNQIVKLLEEEPDIDVATTRTTDTYLTLSERAQYANQINADMFISVHANAASRSTTGGTETFVFYNADRTFGSIVHKHLINATQLTNRGLKEAGFRVLKETNMPAALIEIAFLSNPYEEKQLNDAQFQDKVAKAMYNAIREYEFGK